MRLWGGIEGHDRCTISRSDRVPRSLQMPHDHGTIAPRSRSDRTAIVEFFRELSPPSDGASGEWTIEMKEGHDCVAIGPRSRRDQVLFYAVRCRSDGDR